MASKSVKIRFESTNECVLLSKSVKIRAGSIQPPAQRFRHSQQSARAAVWRRHARVRQAPNAP